MRSLISIFALVATLSFSAIAAGFAQSSPVTVVVNGQGVNFDQPPVERAGRVFVPLRGVFERLGASVVYEGGLINATGNGRSISLRIGSTQATVNGQTQYLDVAPFLIGARTLVPLRFVAQALGAAVDWNQSTNTVRITGNGSPSYSNNATPTPVPYNDSFSLVNPTPTGIVIGRQPTLRARFSEPVQPATVRVRIDGVDMGSNLYANANRFGITPPSPLSSGPHTIRVSGLTQAGAQFSAGWTFITP